MEQAGMLFFNAQVVSKAIRYDWLFIAIGLTGRVPDGLLFSISGISTEVNAAQRLQADFAGQILSAVDVQASKRPFGASAIAIEG